MFWVIGHEYVYSKEGMNVKLRFIAQFDIHTKALAVRDAMVLSSKTNEHFSVMLEMR